MISLTELTERRRACSDYTEQTVEPLLGLTKSELESMHFVDVSKRILDGAVRKRYCQLADDLLGANIEFYSHLAEPVPVPKHHEAELRVFTLVVAGIANYLSGLTAALLSAAAFYWLGAVADKRRILEAAASAESHNSSTMEWAKTIRDWEVQRTGLRRSVSETPSG